VARLPRLSLANEVHVVTLRGHNGQAVFVDGQDRLAFLALLMEHAERERVLVHAYVLMDERVVLLLTPQQEGALSRCMQGVGRSYGRRFNQRHGRSGTLWEGRFRSTPIQPERYLLPVMVFMDLEPVVSGRVQAPEAYPWSSHGHYTGLRHERGLTPHPLVWALGNTPFAREAAYASLVRTGLAPGFRQTLGESVLRGWALGDAPFLDRLRERTPRRLEKARPGRPRLPRTPAP
jgi:putative transposase